MQLERLGGRGWAMHRGSSRPIRRFRVMGERSSGTNLMEWLMEANTGIAAVGRSRWRNSGPIRLAGTRLGLNLKDPRLGFYGWKHGFPTFPAIGRSDLLIVMFRDAFSWLTSMYAKPWHASDAMLTLDFDAFLRAEWDARVDRPWRYFDARDVEDFEDLPLRLDRHPITGKPFENIVKLRNAKNQAFLGLGELGGNIVFARHEAVASEPAAFFEDLAGTFGIPAPATLEVQEKRMGGEWKGRTDERYAAARDAIGSERDFILSELDREIERVIGYDYASSAS